MQSNTPDTNWSTPDSKSWQNSAIKKKLDMSEEGPLRLGNRMRKSFTEVIEEEDEVTDLKNV